MEFPIELVDKYVELDHWNILHCYRGSIAHNMYISEDRDDSIDDKDSMSFFIPPENHFLGIYWSAKSRADKRGTKEIFDGIWDIVAYDVRKAMHLLYKSNPNTLSALWVKPEHYINLTSAGQLLLDNRDIFSTKKSFKSFQGYAYSQLKKMETKERHGFKSGKRMAQINKFGFDVKMASHLIRLLRVGNEFLLTGKLNVWREDADELMDIKVGKWSLEQVKKEGEKLFKFLDNSLEVSPLPEKPDREVVNQLCVDMVRMHWQEKGW